jgi:secondary thiamine-phosphate synthase enzyme
MTVIHHELTFSTSGHGHTLNLSDDLTTWLGDSGVREGTVTVFTPGSTAAVTTIEFEPGALRDLQEALERIAPSGPEYHHDARWGDGNGFSHLRAALLGPSVTLPVSDGRPVLGTWQQVVVVECDLNPRRRRVVFTFVGECRGSGCRTSS